MDKNPVDTLNKLFELCVPHSKLIFVGTNTPLKLLHMNDYVMEKAFVYGWMLLSKWLGSDRLMYGLYGMWPPQFPDHLLAAPKQAVVDVDAKATSHAPVSASASSSG